MLPTDYSTYDEFQKDFETGKAVNSHISVEPLVEGEDTTDPHQADDVGVPEQEGSTTINKNMPAHIDVGIGKQPGQYLFLQDIPGVNDEYTAVLSRDQMYKTYERARGIWIYRSLYTGGIPSHFPSNLTDALLDPDILSDISCKPISMNDHLTTRNREGLDGETSLNLRIPRQVNLGSLFDNEEERAEMIKLDTLDHVKRLSFQVHPCPEPTWMHEASRGVVEYGNSGTSSVPLIRLHRDTKYSKTYSSKGESVSNASARISLADYEVKLGQSYLQTKRILGRQLKKSGKQVDTTATFQVDLEPATQ